MHYAKWNTKNKNKLKKCLEDCLHAPHSTRDSKSEEEMDMDTTKDHSRLEDNNMERFDFLKKNKKEKEKKNENEFHQIQFWRRLLLIFVSFEMEKLKQKKEKRKKHFFLDFLLDFPNQKEQKFKRQFKNLIWIDFKIGCKLI